MLNKRQKIFNLFIIRIIYFADKTDKCREQMQIISDDLTKIFPNANKIKNKHSYDKSGEV